MEGKKKAPPTTQQHDSDVHNDLWQPKIRSQPLGQLEPGANGPLLWGNTRSVQKKKCFTPILKRKERYVAKSIPSEETFENINV